MKAVQLCTFREVSFCSDDSQTVSCCVVLPAVGLAVLKYNGNIQFYSIHVPNSLKHLQTLIYVNLRVYSRCRTGIFSTFARNCLQTFCQGMTVTYYCCEVLIHA